MPSPDLRRKVGQLFAVGFHGLTPTPEIQTLIRDYQIGGVVLFKRNISDAAQLRSLTLALQEEARLAGHEHPLFIGIDQENGLVTRISPPICAQLPGPMTLGATYSPDLAYQVGAATGESLGFFGVNMNYAPVCDANSEPLNPVIGVRSPGDDPEFVGRFASATARGLREQKVVPSVKHFPGHGDTAVDSHYGLPIITKTREQLERCELVPFRRAVAEDVESVMTAHIALPDIDEGSIPSTLSPKVIGILRDDMQYDGMVITDCLEMDGIRATYGTELGSVMALNAGCDSLMICHTYSVQTASINQVCQAVESGTVPASRLDEAYNRVAKLKSEFLSWESALTQRIPEDLTRLNQRSSILAKEVYSRSVTVVRDEAKCLPLARATNILFLFPDGQIPAGGAVDGEGEGRRGFYASSAYSDLLGNYSQDVVEIRYGPLGLTADQLAHVAAADAVIFTSMNARESPSQRALGFELSNKARLLISVAMCSPYDFIDDAGIKTYITTYEPTMEAFAAAVDVIFGASAARGVLPVGTQKTSQLPFQVAPLDMDRDLPQLAEVWNAALPGYPLRAESLWKLLAWPNAHHVVARTELALVGFCLAYASTEQDSACAYLAALVVDPKRQGQGVGTALLTETRARLRSNVKPRRILLGSSFPRFWPGVPTDLPSAVLEFFIHRGFHINPPTPRSVDLYQDIKDFQAPEKYVVRAKEQGYTFGPLQPDQYEECLVGQNRNFSHNPAWVGMYVKVDPKEHPSSVMTAFDSQGKQVGWTLMLSPSSSILQQHWACPPVCGPDTGLIGCVGVDERHRKSGIGLALLSHALENMKQRGIKGAFVDWVSLEGYYEKVGFQVWRSYRTGEM